jgi:hypothetical protein
VRDVSLSVWTFGYAVLDDCEVGIARSSCRQLDPAKSAQIRAAVLTMKGSRRCRALDCLAAGHDLKQNRR